MITIKEMKMIAIAMAKTRPSDKSTYDLLTWKSTVHRIVDVMPRRKSFNHENFIDICYTYEDPTCMSKLPYALRKENLTS